MLEKAIRIDDKSGIPKYKQIILSLFHAIENNKIVKGDKIPSINEVAQEFSLSRDTVMTAFNELKIRGIIASTPGKGYYIKSTEVEREQSIFLLFDELNSFKEILYNSFMESMKGKASVDIYFHYFSKKMFTNLIRENLGRYTTYIIMPVYFSGINPIVSQISNANVYILDQLNPEFADGYPAIYQNFRYDIFHALQTGLNKLKKYKNLIMVYPGGKEPVGMLEGFHDFCEEHDFDYEVIKNLNERHLSYGEVYIMPNDLHLVELVKKARNQGYTPGREIGVISYNDTPLKEVVAEGITTISTDFAAMGKNLANMVLTKSKAQIENPSSLILRNSL
jgi:DNA-binding transcriptional regulator YhcF (GntR family)